MQDPLPAAMGKGASQRVFDAIAPAKDVDGFHPENAGRLSQGRVTLAPCTPSGVIEMLRRSQIPMRGADAVDGVIRVELFDEFQQVVERRRCRQAMRADGNARLGCRLLFAADVDGRGGIVAGEDEREAGRTACRRGKRRDGRFEFFTDGRRNSGAIQFASRQSYAPSLRSLLFRIP